MNIIEVFTLNRHGDFQEVMFSSLLSYLLNPEYDHGLKYTLLSKITKEVFPDFDDSWLENVKVESEYPLGGGRVDIYIIMGKKILAVEVKIWDNSSKNDTKKGISQIENYCNSLSEKHKKDDWRFIYLIPTLTSRKCVAEFSKIYSREYHDNLRLMAWSGSTDDNLAVNKFSGNAIVGKTIIDIMAEILENKEVKRVKIPLNTQWLLDSLYDFIPNLSKNIPDTVKFPIKDDLDRLPTEKIFNMFFNVARRLRSPILSSVGVPYGVGKGKAKLHGNSLYRIRTTTSYYTQQSDKANFLPKDNVEIELWPDVYKEMEEELTQWIGKHTSSVKLIEDQKHLDSKEKESVIVISINKDAEVMETDITDLNGILRRGFDILENRT